MILKSWTCTGVRAGLRRCVLVAIVFGMLLVGVLFPMIRTELFPTPSWIHRKLIQCNWTLPALRDDLHRSIGLFHVKHWLNDSSLPRRVTHLEYMAIVDMVQAVDQVFRKWNITYFMAGGTLIGSYYHHDMVPWDDDVDLLVDFFKRKEMMEALRSLGNKYQVHERVNVVKVFPSDGRPYDTHPWHWPFIDIFLFLMDGESWFEIDMPDVLIPIKDVFPLTLRPFGPLWLPAPYNVSTNIRLTERFKNAERTCASNSYDHIHEKGMKSYQVPCRRLMKSYPFVTQRRSAAWPWSHVEVLQINNRTVQEVPIPAAVG